MSTLFFFGTVLNLLILFFCFNSKDTINRLQRIDSVEVDGEQRQHYDYSYEANNKAKKFYAQRNLYLTGFTLFLSL